MQQFLAFELDGRRFGLAASAVAEVTRAVAITALPRTPPIVEGVINLRGALVPVLDVRSRFGLPPASLSPDQHLIVADAGERRVALRVDRAVDLIPVDPASIEPATGVVPGVEHASGIARLDDGVLVIHDLAAFLSLEEAAALDDALGPPPVEPRAARARPPRT